MNESYNMIEQIYGEKTPISAKFKQNCVESVNIRPES